MLGFGHWSEFEHWSGKHHFSDFRKGANKWTTTPEIFETKIKSKNHDKFLEFSKNFTFSRSLMLPQQPKKSAVGAMCPP